MVGGEYLAFSGYSHCPVPHLHGQGHSHVVHCGLEELRGGRQLID